MVKYLQKDVVGEYTAAEIKQAENPFVLEFHPESGAER
jgi:hypothetical protein